ncbi:MAG: A24 family peptidase [Steroidobacteraceae bacterium]
MGIADTFASAPWIYVASAALIGCLIGSFLNVVIHRLPRMLERAWKAQCVEIMGGTEAAEAAAPYNLIVPRSACPACQAPIKAVHNVPLLSYLWLRGRCAQCGKAIGRRYFLIELVTGLAFAIVAWRFGFNWIAMAAMVVSAFLIALTAIDIDTQLLPDSLTLPLMWLGLLASLIGPLTGSGFAIPVAPRDALMGAAAGYLSLWSVYQLFKLLTGKEGMGYGDFKLLAALGAWMGWQMLLPIILASAAVGAVTGSILLAVQGREKSTPIAFGPYLAGAGWIVMLVGPQLVSRYLGLFGQAH